MGPGNASARGIRVTARARARATFSGLCGPGLTAGRVHIGQPIGCGGSLLAATGQRHGGHWKPVVPTAAEDYARTSPVYRQGALVSNPSRAIFIKDGHIK